MASRIKNASAALIVLVSVWHTNLAGETKPDHSLPVERWKENAPGCTARRGADGKYNYGIRTKDLRVSLAVDSQELQLTRRRLGHFLGVFLDVQYEGSGTLIFDPGTATIEYASHYHVIKASLDPEDFSERIESG